VIARQDDLLDLVRRAGLPGIVGAAAGPHELLDATCCGHRELDGREPMSLETVFWIASITKVATAVAVLQLVERGALSLDDQVARFLPCFREPQVLTEAGLVPSRVAVTVRHLLTHTAGFGYEAWSQTLSDHVARHSLPAARSGSRASLARPLLFQPGEMWNYGIGMDWAGRLVEEVSGAALADYLREHVFRPLDMMSTGFTPASTMGGQAALYARQADGSLVAMPNIPNPAREFDSGGAGLYSTPRDVLRLLQSLLRAHQGSTHEVLSPGIVASARLNQISGLEVRDLPSCAPERTMALSVDPGQCTKWSFFGLLHLQGHPDRRSPGSVSWAGIANTFFWLDFDSAVAAIVFAQNLPFLDPAVLPAVDLYERSLYVSLKNRG
jgi:methyl acetate hydrolase